MHLTTRRDTPPKRGDCLQFIIQIQAHLTTRSKLSELILFKAHFLFSMADEVPPRLDGDGDKLEYYSLLNVGRNATVEEIRRAYRRLCKTYHPDRYQDERRQGIAAEHFPRIQEAYKVLNDPRLREIYDRRGKIGLMEDMAIVERTSIPAELFEEYEKLRALWEERTYIQESCPMGNFKLEFDVTNLLDGENYGDDAYDDGADDYDSDDGDDQPQIAFTGFSFEQSVHATITRSDIGTVTGFGFTKKSKTEPQFPLQYYNGGESQVSYGSGLLFSLKRMLTNQNFVEFSAVVRDNPAIGLMIGHEVGGGIFGTLGSTISLASNSNLKFSANCVLQKHLSNSTMGLLTVNLLGNSTSLKFVHQYSSTTSFSGAVAMGVEGSYWKGALLYQLIPKYIFRAGMKMGTDGLGFEYGVEHEIAKLTTVGASVSLNPSSGVSLKLMLGRAFMNFSIKIKVSDFVGPAALLYATSAPLALYGCIKAIALAPIVQREWLDEVAKKKVEMSKEVAEKKARAESAIELMQETLERVVSAEQAKHGLLIVEAWYGKLFDQIQSDEGQIKVIDVRIPLQCLVVDSKLILHGTGKADIPGFYDPCVGERKYLRVRYEFRGTAHEVTVEDSEPLVIPKPSHKLGNS